MRPDSAKAASTSGARNQNTAFQSQRSTRRPPTRGPSAEPAAADGGVGAEHARALALLEQRGGERGPAAQRQGDADPLQHAAEQQQPVARRQRAAGKARSAHQQPELEDAAIAQEVAELAEDQHQARVGQHVGDHHPADVLHLERERAGDAGKGDVDGGVERSGDGAEADDEQPDAGSRRVRHRWRLRQQPAEGLDEAVDVGLVVVDVRADAQAAERGAPCRSFSAASRSTSRLGMPFGKLDAQDVRRAQRGSREARRRGSRRPSASRAVSMASRSTHRIGAPLGHHLHADRRHLHGDEVVALAHVEAPRIADVGGVARNRSSCSARTAARARSSSAPAACRPGGAWRHRGRRGRRDRAATCRSGRPRSRDRARARRAASRRRACVASTSSAAPCARSAGATRSRSTAPPSDQCTEEIEASATGAAPVRSIAVSTAAVQSPLPGRRTVSTVKPPASARAIHSSTGEEWSSSSTSTRDARRHGQHLGRRRHAVGDRGDQRDVARDRR